MNCTLQLLGSAKVIRYPNLGSNKKSKKHIIRIQYTSVVGNLWPVKRRNARMRERMNYYDY